MAADAEAELRVLVENLPRVGPRWLVLEVGRDEFGIGQRARHVAAHGLFRSGGLIAGKLAMDVGGERLEGVAHRVSPSLRSSRPADRRDGGAASQTNISTRC